MRVYRTEVFAVVMHLQRPPVQVQQQANLVPYRHALPAPHATSEIVQVRPEAFVRLHLDIQGCDGLQS